MKFGKPGDLIKASRDKKQKRAVMKAIGMPMKKRKPVKMSGTFGGKSNQLGQGGRAAQLKARGVPGGVIGNLARRAQAAPGQKNFHKKSKKAKKMTQTQDDAYDKKRGIKEGSRADMIQDRKNGIKDKKKKAKKAVGHA